jgi:hypothetical protein
MIKSHFDEVRTLPAFGSLSEEHICSLLADDALGITAEEAAFEAAVTWLGAQPAQPPADRARTVSRLLGLVRFPTMARPFLETTVLPHPLLQPPHTLDKTLDVGAAAAAQVEARTPSNAAPSPRRLT